MIVLEFFIHLLIYLFIAESFDHDVVNTVSSFSSTNIDTPVFVISENVPYPYFELPDGKTKVSLGHYPQFVLFLNS